MFYKELVSFSSDNNQIQNLNISTLLGTRSGSNLSQSVPIVYLKFVGLGTFTTPFPPLTWLILLPSIKTGIAMSLHRSVNTFHYYFYIFIMEWPILVKCLMLGLIVQIQIHGHRGCFEEERMGLSEIKEFVRSNGNDVDHLLHSWVNDPKSECCDSERVICDSNTGHVVELFLQMSRNYHMFMVLVLSIISYEMTGIITLITWKQIIQCGSWTFLYLMLSMN